MLTFVKPVAGMRAEVMVFLNAFFEAGETVVNGSVGLDMMKDYDAWLGYVQRLNTGEEEGLGLGPTEVYFARNEGGKIVGVLDLRPGLPAAKYHWGHIGYSVAPEYRGHGYAPEMLSWGVDALRRRGAGDILAATYEDNTASGRVLKKCGFLQTGSYLEPETGRRVINYTNINQ